MQYEEIILELLSRIKKLEASHKELEERILQIENEEMRSCEQSADQTLQSFADEVIDEMILGASHRQKMTAEMIQACYVCGVALSKNDGADFKQAIDNLVAEVNMNRNSAVMYVYAVKGMLNGEIYKRSISQTATEQYYKNILRDFGKGGLEKALLAARAHNEYRLQCGHTIDGLITLRKEYEKYL